MNLCEDVTGQLPYVLVRSGTCRHTYCCFSSGRGLTPPTEDSSSRWTAVLKRFQNAGSRTPDIVVYVLVGMISRRELQVKVE